MSKGYSQKVRNFPSSVNHTPFPLPATPYAHTHTHTRAHTYTNELKHYLAKWLHMLKAIYFPSASLYVIPDSPLN